MHRKYEGRAMATLTPIEAQEIMLLSFFYDMPNLSTYSLSFALFKTYGIVSQYSSCILPSSMQIRMVPRLTRSVINYSPLYQDFCVKRESSAGVVRSRSVTQT